VAGALLATAEPALTRLGDIAVARLEHDWGATSTGERVGLVSFGIGMGSLLGYGLVASPDARGLLLDQLNGAVIPVPGAGWLGLEMYTGGDQLMLGAHLDVGRLLPEALGFGAASFNAIGGAPVPQPFVPGQREASEAGLPDVPTDAGARIAAASGGLPLPETARSKLEAGLASDLSGVRIHADSGADALSRDLAADAFTSGQHIFVRAGNYRPDTDAGLRLLAHEAAHTVQQASGPVGGVHAGGGVALSRPGDALEREADAAAGRVLDGGAGAALSVGATRQVSRKPTPGGRGKARKEAPNANALLTKSQPHLLTALSKEQLDSLQRYYDSKPNIDAWVEERNLLPTNGLSDVRRREDLNARINAELNRVARAANIAVSMDRLLGGDVLPKPDVPLDKQGMGWRTALFREQFYRDLMARPAWLALQAGDAPDPVFRMYWGPGQWELKHDKGLIGFAHLIGSSQKWWLDYEQARLGDEIELTDEMYELSRGLGGQHLNLAGKKLGEIHGAVWNSSVTLGQEVGELHGYYDDARGRAELYQVLFKVPAARVVVKGPDGWLHLYTANPSFKHGDLTSPDDDNTVYLLASGSQAGNVWMIVTADGATLERGGKGWRAPKDPNALTRVEKFAIGAIFGDWFEDPSVDSTLGQIFIGVIPIVGQIADARDVAAGIYKMWSSGGNDGKLQTALALVGLVPLFGDAIKAAKGAGKSVKEAMQGAAGNATGSLARQIMRNSDDVAAVFGLSKAVKEEIAEELGGGLSKLKSAQEALEQAKKIPGGATAKEAEALALAANEYAQAVGKRLEEFGGNAGALVKMSGGSWKAVTEALAAAGEQGAKVGAKMEAWRASIVPMLKGELDSVRREFSGGFTDRTLAPPEIQRTGTPKFNSDLDVNFLGPDATLYRNAAERAMAARYGADWKNLLDASFLIDPRRLHLFDELAPEAARKVERVMVGESELNVLARMLRDGHPIEEVRKTAASLGVPLPRIEARAAEIGALAADPAKVARMELEMDALHRKFAAETDPLRKAALAQEMSSKQSLINATNKEAYLTPGGAALHVTRRDDIAKVRSGPFVPISPAMGYMVVLDNLATLTHASARGPLEEQIKSMAKYAERLMITAGQHGADTAGSNAARATFDAMSDTLLVARKDPAKITSLGLPANGAFASLDRQLGELVKAVKSNADAYFAQGAKGTDRATGGLSVARAAKALDQHKWTLARTLSIVLRKINQQNENDAKANAPIQPTPVQRAPQGSFMGAQRDASVDSGSLLGVFAATPLTPDRFDPARRVEDLMRAESILHTARESADDIPGSLAPDYLAARDALDVETLGASGGRLLAAYGVLHGARAALDELQARMPRQSVRDTPLEDDLAFAIAQHNLEAGLPELDARLPVIDQILADTLTPHRFGGNEVTGQAAGPVLELGDRYVAARLVRLEYELHRTMQMLAAAREVKTLVSQYLRDPAPPRPPTYPGGALALGPRGPLDEARDLLVPWASRPLDLAWLRAALGTNWDLLDVTTTGPRPSDALAEATRQASHTGWLGDIGGFDIHLADTMLRIGGGRDDATPVLRQLYSADPDTRAGLLMQLKRRGLFDKLCSAFGWADIKQLHDSLGSGFAEIKTDLQAYFIGKGKYGPSLGEEWEQHDLSASGWFARNLGFVGRGINKVLDVGSFGFYGSYSDAIGAESQGLISADDARAARAHAAGRTLVVGAASMLTGGVADKFVRGGAATVGSARAFGAGAAGGGVGAVAGLGASDAYNIQIAGTQSSFSSLSDYAKAALLGGVIGGAYQGARQFRGNRANRTAGAADATPSGPATGNTTAVEVSPAEVRRAWNDNPGAMNKSHGNEFHQQQWARNGGVGPAPIAFRTGSMIRVNEERWLAVGDLAEINFAADLRPAPTGARGGTARADPALADTQPQIPARGATVDPLARTQPDPALADTQPLAPARPNAALARTDPAAALADTQPAPAGSRSTALSLPPTAAPRGYSPVPPEVVLEAYQLNPHAIVPSYSSRFHQMVWEHGGGAGRNPPLAYRVGNQIRVDVERWPAGQRAAIGL
jgi:hypothetical protein